MARTGSTALRLLLLTTIAGGFVPLVMAGPARAGGGCHRNQTVSEGTGMTLEIVENCFSPSVLRTTPGGSVTFVNRSGGVHDVMGEAGRWGSDGTLANGQSFVASFPAAGTYPFECSLHPGMTGAVVVGEGRAATTNVEALPVSAAPVTSLAAASAPAPASVPSSDGSGSSAVLAAVVTAIVGLALGFTAGRAGSGRSPA
jgi:plastocyanin